CCMVGFCAAWARPQSAASTIARAVFIGGSPGWTRRAYNAARPGLAPGPQPSGLAIEPLHERPHVRVDDVAPAPAAEDSIVAGTRDFDVRAVALRNPAAEVVRRAGLADAGDVVEFAFDRQQRGLADRGRRHRLAVDAPGAERQPVLLEHDADRVEVELGRKVEHGVV